MRLRLTPAILTFALAALAIAVVRYSPAPPSSTPTAAAPARVAKAVQAQPEQQPVAADPSEPIHGEVAACEVIGSAWNTVIPPEFAALRDWSKRYFAASAADRPALLDEGIKLAQARREVMARLISTDPELALALAVPMVVRQNLPAEIVAQLEDRVSGRGNLNLMGATAEEGQSVEQPVFRSAVIGDKQYDAYVYGRRNSQLTLLKPTSIIGVALNGKLAVSETPVRVLEKGELAANRPVSNICDISGNTTAVNESAPLNEADSNAIEYNGVVHILCASAHLAQVEAKLRAQEQDNTDPTQIAADLNQVAADGSPGSSTVSGRPSYAWTHGTKKVLIMLVDFSDKVGGSTTVDGASATMSGANGVHDFYNNSSFGATNVQCGASVAGVSPDITPVMRMPQTGAAYVGSAGYYGLMNDARTAAAAAGYNPNNYDLVGVAFPSIGYGWAGLGYVGASGFWIQGGFSLRVVGHEMGHNYGLWHANLWKVTDGNPVSATGANQEYGDPFDIMGGGGSIGSEFSLWNKSILQWIPDNSIPVANSAGTYRIYRFDRVPTANLALARGLKVVRDSTFDYWIAYRRGSGNASLNGGAYIVWGYNSNQGGELLDMNTPGNTPSDAGLLIGQTFLDPATGISIHPVAQGGTGNDEYLDVQIAFQPRIQWSQATFAADAQGGHAYLRVSRTKNSSGAVTINYATASGTAVSPTNFTAQSGTLSWADGDMSDKVIDVLINPRAAAGATTNFTVTLSGISAGATLAGNAAATVNLIDAGIRDGSFASVYISNGVRKVLPLPDGSMIIGGGFTYLYNAAFNYYPIAGVGRLLASGDVDPTFATAGGAAGTVYDLARQPDGKIIGVGQFSTVNGVTGKTNLFRLLADGTLDATFTPGTGPNGIIYSVLVQPDGKILIGGAFTSFSGTAREYLARLNANGTLDATFVGPDFNGTTGGKVTSLALQPDGKLLVAGSFAHSGNIANLCRVTTTGALDATFNGLTTGANGTVNKVVLQPDGKILLAGAFTTFNGTSRGGLTRLSTTGAIDATFVPPATNGNCLTMLVEPDGSLLVGAAVAASAPAPAAPRRLVHYSSTGTVDAGFNLAADSTGDVYDLELAANGRVLFGSAYITFQGASLSSSVWQISAGLAGLPGTVQFSSATASGNEGTSVTLTVTRTGGSLGALTVGYATVPGTATIADYTPASGVLTWANGDTAAKTITIPLTSDALVEAVETFKVNLGQPLLGGALLDTTQQAVVSINSVVSAGVANDFNGDGKSDIVWENTTTGERYLWLMNGTAYGSGVSLGTIPTTWRIAGTGDFNGDGKTDILWENTSTGERYLWLMNGTTYISGLTLGVIPTAWRIATTGDFNGDGKTDIVWENTTTGERYIWLMNGTTYGSGVSLGTIPTAWRIAGAGDFNGDGKTDLLWENTTTGERYLWLMNGTTYASGLTLGVIPTTWRITATGDYNGDGKVDILWENTSTGERYLWLMNGTAYGSGLSLGTIPNAWRIAP